MPLQDLTPELRTRLSRAERIVGWFVTFATILLLAGFAYYIYATAQKRGWFVTKINYATSFNDATGFTPGDPVKLMGLNIGEVTRVELNPPEQARGVTVFFNIREPYYGYIWYDSQIKVVSDFLGHRYLEVQKGRTGEPTAEKNQSGELLVMNRYVVYQKYKTLTNELRANAANSKLSDQDIAIKATDELMTLVKTDTNTYYTNAIEAGYNKAVDLTRTNTMRNYCFVPALDSPALGDRLNAVADQLQAALPNILTLTNQLAAVLSNANNAVAQVNKTLERTDPILSNADAITKNLRDPNGSLGNWLIPTNLSAQLHATLRSADETLHSTTETMDAAHFTLNHTDTNITMLALDLDQTLEHLADLTSNLNSQVQMNSNLVSEISTTIVHADGFIQGLKHHWLLRSAFKKKPENKKTDPPPAPDPNH